MRHTRELHARRPHACLQMEVWIEGVASSSDRAQNIATCNCLAWLQAGRVLQVSIHQVERALIDLPGFVDIAICRRTG